jgi:hypothetical protein
VKKPKEREGILSWGKGRGKGKEEKESTKIGRMNKMYFLPCFSTPFSFSDFSVGFWKNVSVTPFSSHIFIPSPIHSLLLAISLPLFPSRFPLFSETYTTFLEKRKEMFQSHSKIVAKERKTVSLREECNKIKRRKHERERK